MSNDKKAFKKRAIDDKNVAMNYFFKSLYHICKHVTKYFRIFASKQLNSLLSTKTLK